MAEEGSRAWAVACRPDRRGRRRDGHLERKGCGRRSVPVEFLRPNPRNPRKAFDDAELQELTQSIKDRGIIQPIVVRPMPNTPMHTRSSPASAAGARRRRRACTGCRWWSSRSTTKTSLEYAILENVQRADLNPIEEAEGYSRLMAEFSYTQENLSKIIGKSRSHIANTLRLSDLPDPCARSC